MLKIKKEDEQNLKDTKKLIGELSQIVASVEQSMETANEKFKKQLEQLIPQLNTTVTNLSTESTEAKYLDDKEPMDEIISELDAKVARFKELEATSIKYNSWQETLNVPPTIFNNLDELKSELFNRHLMWHSMQEWDELLKGQTCLAFGKIDAVEIQKQCDKYLKIAIRVGKVLPVNYIQ